MSNTVWEYKLNPIEFVILSYLCFCQSHNQAVTPAPETIAEATRLTANTVKKYLTSL